jgi:hypothetical protein
MIPEKRPVSPMRLVVKLSLSMSETNVETRSIAKAVATAAERAITRLEKRKPIAKRAVSAREMN